MDGHGDDARGDAPDGVDLVARAAATAEATAAANAGLAAPPRRHLALLTCMDARVLPHDALGFGHGDVHVVRNAGGRATPDACRSLAVSCRLLGVERVAVVHHTGCGNAAPEEDLRAALAATGLDAPPWPLHAGGGTAADVEADVATLLGDGSLPDGVLVEGHVLDVATGRLARVTGPTPVG